MRKIAAACICIITSLHFTADCQEEYPLINSGELIKQGIILTDSGLFKKAIALYEQVTRNDTNYIKSLYQKAVTLEADSQFNESIRCYEQALKLSSQSELEPDIYNNYGNMLNSAGQAKRALAVFDSAINKYPQYSLLYFNKGIVYLNQDLFPEAEDCFKKALLINPYQYSAHFNLGLVALRQGKIIPAFLSFTGYLLMTPEGRYWSHTINLLSQISKATDEILEYKNKRSAEPDANFQLIEEILLSRIALDKQYKPIIKLDDPISRQIQVVFEKLDYDESGTDFYMQYYLPYFKKIFSAGEFETFINHIFFSAKVASITEYNKKNKKERDALMLDAAAYFDLVRSTKELSFPKRATTDIRYVYDNGQLVGRGKLINNFQVTNGPWEFYYPAGNKKATGQFNAEGKRDGVWNFYFFNGDPDATENYINGKLEGKQVYNFNNGNLSSEKEYHNDVEDGITSRYFRCGNPLSLAKYKAGKMEGEKKSYYPNRTLHSSITYSNDEANGPFIFYYQDGQVSEAGTYKAGKLDGNYKSYHENGQLSSEGNYINDKKEGEWKTYHANGKIKEKEFYKNNLMEGGYEQYFDNGQLYTKFSSRKGITDGTITYYDRDGKVSSILAFEKDIMKSAVYFDKSGKEIHRSERNGKELNLEVYSPGGYKTKTGSYDNKGYTKGTETFFYANGAVSSRSEYRDGVLNGTYTSYFSNGKPGTEVNMTDGNKDGFYKEYFSHGQLQSEGWYKEDQMQGEWRFFDEQGHLVSKSYYLNGDLSGYKEDYRPDGKLYMEQRYKGGWLEEMTQFDSLGKVLRHDSFPKGQGKYVLVYPDGKKMDEGQYVNGYLEGKYSTYYFDGSLKSIQFYKKGMADSINTVYYYGGKKYSEGYFKNGKRNGKWKTYDEDGTLSSVADYVLGDLSGKKTYYYKDGKTDLDVSYKNGRRDGLSKKFDNDGTLMYQVRFEDDEPKGYSYLNNKAGLAEEQAISSPGDSIRTYYPSGNISRVFSTRNGKLHGNDIVYYRNGQPRSVNSYEDGIYEGEYKEFYADGKTKYQSFFRHDNQDGPYKQYNEKGVLEEEGNLYNGSYHGKVIKYDGNGHIVSTYLYYYGLLMGVKK